MLIDKETKSLILQSLVYNVFSVTMEKQQSSIGIVLVLLINAHGFKDGVGLILRSFISTNPLHWPHKEFTKQDVLVYVFL